MGLPDSIPLFPLPNVVLFPDVLLPLHIFEHRYRDMVRDAEASESKLIGMVLLRGDWREEYHGRPDVFPTGCAGRIIRSQKLDDGRYNILLQGVREFELRREVGEGLYRCAEVNWRPAPAGGLREAVADHVRSLAKRFLEHRDAEMVRRLLEDPSMAEGFRLINFLSFALDSPPMEKLALLEAASPRERAVRLCQVLEFGIGGGGSQAGGSVH